MWREKIRKALKNAVLELGFITHDIDLYTSEIDKFGDYTSNIALQLSKQEASKNYHSSFDIANAILEKLGHPNFLERVEVAGPGFINFFLKDESLVKGLFAEAGTEEEIRIAPVRYLVEYASPNAAKPFHIGHLRNITLGESISRVLAFQGHEIYRANYSSDIGLPIAKVVWGVKKNLEEFEKLKKEDGSLAGRVDFMGRLYVFASKEYEENETSKKEINEINKAIYEHEEQAISIWQTVRNWSEVYFEVIYSRLGSEFDVTIWESEVEEQGKKIVLDNIGKVFVEDGGAVIFPGEKYGLHNRVFITSAGNPTYEAKELGVTVKEESLFPFDIALHIVGNEQIGYFSVVIKAVELVEERLKGRKKHVPYGFVNLTTGKMSSREGNIIKAEELIDMVKEKIKAEFLSSTAMQDDRIVEKIAIGAIKFSFLQYGSITDISFDIDKSISLQGDSGPYVMYTFTRIASLLSKEDRAKKIEAEDGTNQAQNGKIAQPQKYTSINIDAKHQEEISRSPANAEHSTGASQGLEDEERALLRQLEYFSSVAEKAAEELSPNTICTYLLELSRLFNLFYERCPVLHSQKEEFRLILSQKVGEVLRVGLYLLGIQEVDKM